MAVAILAHIVCKIADIPIDGGIGTKKSCRYACRPSKLDLRASPTFSWIRIQWDLKLFAYALLDPDPKIVSDQVLDVTLDPN